MAEEITSTYDDLGLRCERDAFDTLFDHAPDKLQVSVTTDWTEIGFNDETVQDIMKVANADSILVQEKVKLN